MSHSKPFFDIIAPRSKFYQGPFGRLCPELPAWRPPFRSDSEAEQFFLNIANKEMVELPGKLPGEIAAKRTLIAKLEAKFSSKIPAGYTYFGQFVDHDITFDPASSLMRQNDPNGLLNHRTPRLDLDNVYGGGPNVHPHLYDNCDRDKFLIGEIEGTKLKDLPRNSQGRALIGDLRNDENAIVSQMQLAFLLAHNRLVERARKAKLANPFERARTTLRWLYQYIVWHDFLPRIAVAKVHRCGLVLKKTCDGRYKWSLDLGDIYKWKHQPFMPVEFSVAAYRFGHSMVRNSYQTNQPHRGSGKFAPIFDNTVKFDHCKDPDSGPDDLRGFRRMKPENVIQWDWFLQMTSSRDPFPQRARKIDTKLANAVTALHEGPVGSQLNILAFRNLLRGYRFDLPAGTDVAKKFCLDPVKVPYDRDALWFYILKEAEIQNRGEKLGHVGSAIVCATFAGLLKGDPCSYFNIEPCWLPGKDPLLKATDNKDPGNWTLASIIRLSGLPVSVRDFPR